ncbi:hypothetical protein ABZP36_020156, partial [Zizania latifolia]
MLAALTDSYATAGSHPEPGTNGTRSTTLVFSDISLIYHVIRGQGTIKLYVVYNVLEIFDKLCQSFGEDVLQALFNSAEGLSTCSTDNATFELMRFILDEAIAVVAFDIFCYKLCTY